MFSLTPTLISQADDADIRRTVMEWIGAVRGFFLHDPLGQKMVEHFKDVGETFEMRRSFSPLVNYKLDGF